MMIIIRFSTDNGGKSDKIWCGGHFQKVVYLGHRSAVVIDRGRGQPGYVQIT